MLPFAEESVDLAIAQCRLAEAVWAVVGWRAQRALTPELQRLGSAICALAGNDRELAAIAQPELLDCSNEAAAASYLAASGAARSQDYLSVAVVIAWSAGPAQAVYRALREAHDRAHAEGRIHVAVAAQERLAHHALLFGDVEIARSAIERAGRLASDRRLTGWRLRCSAVAANLAFDSGDADSAARLVSRARAESPPAEALAAFAPAGASLAAADGDDAALSSWSSTEMRELALNADAQEAAAAATVACLIAASPPLEPPLALALRRNLLWAAGNAGAAELFSAAARCGDLEQAAYAVDALRALPAPDRPYLKSHFLLARAHLSFRREDTSWIDDAGDAARAFNAMGLRRRTNEAMLLLVRQEGDADRKRRRRPSASALTGREQQVAQLIRRGARNREVALALQISEHTVERHVSSILGRLGLRSRWQIAEPQKADEG